MGLFDNKPPPPKKKADFSNVQSGQSTTAPPPAPPKPVAPPPPKPITYTVAPGDSLSLIAKKFLGKAGRWTEIYQANKAVIGGNPDLIKPGQVLTLPADASDPGGKK
jgi:nucleoid-associated protein YgaU